MKVILFLPLILCAILVGLFSFTLLSGEAETKVPLIGQTLPPFQLTDVSRSKPTAFSPTTMKKPALLLFWASWCGVCKVDMPVLGQFATANKIPLYGIAYHDQPDALKEAVKNFKKDVTFTALGEDPNGSISSQYGLIGIPTLFVIDKQGIIRKVIAGQASREDLDHDVRPLLQ